MVDTTLSEQTILQRAFDETTGVLRTSATLTASTIDVNLDAENDTVQIFGTDGTTLRGLKTDADGHIQTLIDDAIATDDSAQVATPKIMNAGGEYRASATTYTNGDATILQTDINGHLKTAGFDSATNSIKNYDINPLNQQFTTPVEIVTAQDLTASYADFGAEIDMRGYTKLGVYIIKDVNDSENVSLQLLAKHTSDGADEYERFGVAATELWTTSPSDGKVYVEFDVAGIPFVQLQAIAGTVGATAGDLTISIIKMY